MMVLLKYLEDRLPRPVVIVFALMFCLAAGLLDTMNGPDYSLVPLYLVPVIMTAWFVGRKTSYLFSCFSALVWLVAEMAGRPDYKLDFAIYWNDLMELLLFILTALIVSALRAALDREKEISRTDALTGLPNRRHYYELVTAEMHRNHRYGEPFTVIYLDIDNFKTVNDSKGHNEGDKVLRQVATTIVSAIRETDTAARLGGDEFALLLPTITKESALELATRVREQLKKDVASHWPVTFSMGMVIYLNSPKTIHGVIGRADRLMYEVKEDNKDALRWEVV